MHLSLSLTGSFSQLRVSEALWGGKSEESQWALHLYTRVVEFSEV